MGGVATTNKTARQVARFTALALAVGRRAKPEPYPGNPLWWPAIDTVQADSGVVSLCRIAQ